MFVAEGIKTIRELLGSRFNPQSLYATTRDLLPDQGYPVTIITERDLKKISGLKTPNKVLGVFHIPPGETLAFSDWIVALDGIQDPGNLGTIIRLCDWFGIGHLVCSPDSVDCYNPKVLQATMGSIARVNVVYSDLPGMFKASGLRVFGAFMDGTSVHEAKLPRSGILVLGNEASGISARAGKGVHERIYIPGYGPALADSLNVATASAILMHEIRRP